MTSPASSPFAYAILRVVPRVDRGECVNAGVVLFCRQRAFLALRRALDERRLLALHPGADAGAARAHLEALARIAAGDATAGPVAASDASERFGWIVAPSSTIVQASPVHTGMTGDPAATLDRLFTALVG